jgi:tRNA modification GTPase
VVSVNDTIAAISTPPGAGLRGMIRISGPRAMAIARATCALDGAPDLARRGGWRGRFDDGRGTQPLLCLAMPAPHSFTREDVVELHLPGSPPLLAAALARVVELGARPAQPGEFTRRAFENGRIDLTQAEGVLDLIEAANEDERRAATALLFGGLSSRVGALREQLVELRALCEASLDFDESDAGHVPTAELRELGLRAREALSEALRWEVRRAQQSPLPRVVLVGAPNAGKSSLFNALGRDRALVSDLPGTTRDSVRCVWRTEALECALVDTAGLDEDALRSHGDDPDRGAQELARADHAGADLLMHVVDARRADLDRILAEHDALPRGPARLLVWSQIDRGGAAPRPSEKIVERVGAGAWAAVSAVTSTGFEALAARVGELLGGGPRPPARAQGTSRELSLRHHAALLAAARQLDRALLGLERREPLDLVAEDLRAATDALDAIAGRTAPDDVLDVVFERFCIGK